MPEEEVKEAIPELMPDVPETFDGRKQGAIPVVPGLMPDEPVKFQEGD